MQRRGDTTASTPGSATRSAQPPMARVSPAAAYYRLTLGDSTVGFALLTLDTSATAVEMVEQVDMRVPDGDSVRHVFQRTSTAFGRRLDFAGVDVIRRDGPARWSIAGRRVSDSAFAWILGEGDQRHGDTTPTAGRPFSSGAALGLAILRGRPPRVGEVRTVLVADPLQRRVIPVEVTIAGDSTAIVPDSAAVQPDTKQWVAARWDTLRIWRLVRRGAGPPIDTWVDEDGLPVLGDIVPGVRAERQPFEVATAAYRSAMAGRFAGLGGRTASRAATAAPRSMASERVLLPPLLADSSGWSQSGLQGGTQQVRGDTLDVHRVMPAAAASPALEPMLIDPVVADTFAGLAAALVGSQPDPRQRAERLLRWTRSTVAPGPDFGPANPLRALRQRRGGPSDRAAVVVELARAAGLDARPVAGLVAVSGGGWARHAWVEIHLGEWVPADPLYLVPLAAWLAPQRLPAGAR